MSIALWDRAFRAGVVSVEGMGSVCLVVGESGVWEGVYSRVILHNGL